MSWLHHSKHYVINRRWTFWLTAGLVALLTSWIAFIGTASAAEQKNTVNLYMFWGDGCPHCAHAKAVLQPFINQNKNIDFKTFEVYYNTQNQQKMQAVGQALNINASGVPLILVGDEAYAGFSDSIGEEIKSRLKYCSDNACPDSVAEAVGVSKPEAKDFSTEPANQTKADTAKRPDKFIDLPLFGTINAAHFSLPVLTAIIALLDGFNPCAMWALLFIITLLIGMHDRKKMWLYGTTFIATSAAVYFVFMAAWLNLFMFIGHLTWVRALIGLLAIGVGSYYLYDWYQKKTGCKITGGEKRQAVFEKLRKIVKEKNLWLGLGGIMLLAAAVNVVELACSAGLPVLYTGILSSAGLPTWQYYAYMLFYILFFMLDDLVVFAIAMKTFQVIGIDSKYTRLTRLVGGILMCILGILLILAPQVLMFG